MKNLHRFAATTIVSFLLYLLLTMSVELPEIILGIGTSLLTALFVTRYLPFTFKTFHPGHLIRAVIYLPIFIWKMVLANIHIAGIVIRPRLTIRPSIARARTDLITPVGKLFLTSSITLTPGTLSVEMKDDSVYVHLVDSSPASDEEARKKIIGPFEDHIKGVTE